MIIGLVAPVFMIIFGISLDRTPMAHPYYYAFAVIMELIGIYDGKYSILQAGIYSPVDT